MAPWEAHPWVEAHPWLYAAMLGVCTLVAAIAVFGFLAREIEQGVLFGLVFGIGEFFSNGLRLRTVLQQRNREKDNHKRFH